MEAVDRLLLFQRYKSPEFGGINMFESYCGISIGCLTNASKNKRGISIRTACKIKEKFPELDMNWVITGKGSMIIVENKQLELYYNMVYEKYSTSLESLGEMINIIKNLNKMSIK